MNLSSKRECIGVFFRIYRLLFSDLKNFSVILILSILPFVVSFSPIYSDSRTEYPLDIRNNFAPTFLHLDPQSVSPTTLPKGKSYFTSGYSFGSDIKESNLNIDKDIPYTYQRPILMNYFIDRYPTTLGSYIASDFYRFGRLENQNRTSIDLETSLFNMRYNYGITNNIEMGFQVSVISYNSGSMDNIINSYHSAIGVRTGKEYSPNNEYRYKLTDGYTNTFLGTPPRTGMGDSVLSLKWNLINSPENGFSLALVSSAKIPTGSMKYEMSNGRGDASAGFSLKYKKDKWIGYFNGYGVYVSNSFGNPDIKLRSFGSASITLEYLLHPKISILAQLDGKSSAFSSHTVYLSRPIVMFSMGANWKVRSTSVLQFSFTEDITITVPDFTMQMNWREYF